MLLIAMLTAPTSTDDGVSPLPATRPLIDIVVPVYNEQGSLEPSIRRLHRFLDDHLPFAWRIVIADNASTDATPTIAADLARELPNTELLRLAAKGRGRALRAAWSRSHADVRCYMDVDLSTDLRALLPLIAGVVSGHSDVAIGTRLAPGSRVVRGPKRELISRSYNRLLRLLLRARFSDAQCGFKAISARAASMLLPEVQDDAWFFDTELLMLAQRRGLRIHEVAVDWVDDPDSSVDIVPTALADLRGVVRLLLRSRFARFALVGVASTLAYALLYLLLRPVLAPVGQRDLARGHCARQHAGQPPPHVRPARHRRAVVPARRRAGGVRAGTRADRCRARRADRDRPRGLAGARGGGASGRERRRHGRSLPGAGAGAQPRRSSRPTAAIISSVRSSRCSGSAPITQVCA